MKQVDTDIEAVLVNGTVVDPIATLEGEEGKYQIIVDRDSYALCERLIPEHLPKGVKGSYTLTPWWPKEAVEVLRLIVANNEE